MRQTTLCYIEKDGAWLMLHRTKKEQDQSHDKWLGVGGKFEDGESPEECMLREVYEETGLTLTEYAYRGIVTFVSDQWETEYMHLFTATGYVGEIGPCDEGVLEWVSMDEVMKLHLWEGDRLFLQRLQGSKDFFSLKVEYEGEHLSAWKFWTK